MSRGSVNKMILIGTLGKDPDIRYMPNGNAVASLSVATDEGYKDKSGQRVDKTEWHRVEAFGKLAEIIGQYLQKGAKAYFEGKLRTDEYEKDGIKRYSTKIIANNMTMLGGKQDGQQPSNGFQQAAPQQAPQQQAQGFQQMPQQAQQQGFQQAAPQQQTPPQNQPMGVHQQHAPQQQPQNQFPDDDVPFI